MCAIGPIQDTAPHLADSKSPFFCFTSNFIITFETKSASTYCSAFYFFHRHKFIRAIHFLVPVCHFNRRAQLNLRISLVVTNIIPIASEHRVWALFTDSKRTSNCDKIIRIISRKDFPNDVDNCEAVEDAKTVEFNFECNRVCERRKVERTAAKNSLRLKYVAVNFQQMENSWN